MTTILMRDLGEIEDKATIEDVENACSVAGGDFAIEFRGEALRLFRVTVVEARA